MFLRALLISLGIGLACGALLRYLRIPALESVAFSAAICAAAALICYRPKR